MYLLPYILSPHFIAADVCSFTTVSFEINKNVQAKLKLTEQN